MRVSPSSRGPAAACASVRLVLRLGHDVPSSRRPTAARLSGWPTAAACIEYAALPLIETPRAHGQGRRRVASVLIVIIIVLLHIVVLAVLAGHTTHPVHLTGCHAREARAVLAAAAQPSAEHEHAEHEHEQRGRTDG